MKAITKIELLTIRDALLSALEEEEVDGEAVCDALDIVNSLLTEEDKFEDTAPRY